MILYIYLTNEVCTPKVKGFINKLLSKMGYVIKYIGDGLAIHDLESKIQIDEINKALQPYRDKYGDNFSTIVAEGNETVNDLELYKKERNW